MYLANNIVPKRINQKLIGLKEEIEISVIIVRDFTILFAVRDRTIRERFSNNMKFLNNMTIILIKWTFIENVPKV